MVVATTWPTFDPFIAAPNHSRSSLLPATVSPVADGLEVSEPLLLAPITSMKHGPAIVAWVIAAVEVADAVTVNVLDSVPSALRYKRLPPYDGVRSEEHTS